MIFSPHTLQRLTTGSYVDENGIPQAGSKEWVGAGDCRCDDNSQHKATSVNGILYEYQYHIVHEGDLIPLGTTVRALDSEGNVRGEGKVIKTGKCNYFSYSEVWV